MFALKLTTAEDLAARHAPDLALSAVRRNMRRHQSRARAERLADREVAVEVRTARRGIMLEAVPVDAFVMGRIEPAVDLEVTVMSDGGLETTASRPLHPGRRVALGFPESPFLPPPGTLAIVEECDRDPESGGFRMRFVYEPTHAA